MVGIFFVIVGSAAFNAVYPTLDGLEKVKQEQQLQKLQDNQLETTQKTVEYYMSLGVQVHTMKALKEYQDAMENAQKSFTADEVIVHNGTIAVVNIWLFILIRFLVQIANLICARTIGVIYRGEIVKDIKMPNSNIKKSDIKNCPVSHVIVEDKKNQKKGDVLKKYPNAVCVRNDEGKYEVRDGENVLAVANHQKYAWREVS
jgi:hypothetical protein